MARIGSKKSQSKKTSENVSEEPQNIELPTSNLGLIDRKSWIKREPVTELGHRIVSAAIEEFATKGIFNARVAEITKKAQTTDPAFYWYFAGMKQAALFIMSEYYWAPLNIRLNHYLQITNDPKQLFDAVIQALIQSTTDNPSHPWLSESKVFNIVVAQMRNPALLPESMLDAEYVTFVNKLGEIVELGQKQKLFSSWLRPELVARLIVNNLHSLLTTNNIALQNSVEKDEVIKVVEKLLGMTN